MGDDIVGTSSNTETGKSVAISDDGSIIAVGSWELTAPGPGSDRVAVTSTYLLTITNMTTDTTSRVLAEGVVDARGNLEARALLPALQPGDYDVVFQGKHRGGAGLGLTARITVGYVGQITVLDRNIPQVW